MLHWLRACARDLSVLRALDEVEHQLDACRGRLQGEDAIRTYLAPFTSVSPLAAVVLAVLDADVDEDPRMVLSLLNVPQEWRC